MKTLGRAIGANKYFIVERRFHKPPGHLRPRDSGLAAIARRRAAYARSRGRRINTGSIE
jgi:hypothetical protein